jgi:hypothetical protein
MKNPIELQLPTGDCFLVVPRMEKSTDRVPFALFDDLPLDLPYGSVAGSVSYPNRASPVQLTSSVDLSPGIQTD